MFSLKHRPTRGTLRMLMNDALGFQHFPRNLANVNEWKIMFDPSIVK